MREDLKDLDAANGIRSIELILNNQNTKQGLGFTVGYRVMDLKTLGNIVATITGVASTAVPILLSLRLSTVEIGSDVDDLCTLSAPQVATIQGVMMGNESCAYNVTLNEIMGM